WHQLHVIIAKKPELNKGQNREITVPVREKVLLSLSGKNFLQDTKVFFRSTGKELKPVQTQYDSHEHLLVHLKPGPEDIGSYSIVIQNTGDKVTEYKDFLILKKSEDPTEKENKTASEHALYRSLLYPGTEQWYRGERTKGHILTGSTVFFLFSYFYFHEQRLKTNLDYQGDVIALSLLPLDYRAFPAAFLLFQAGQDTRQTTRKNLKLEKYALNALIGIYLYNTYDVFSNRGGFSFSYSSDKKEESFQLGYSIRF
ncbi:MAG: hypothetical protein KDK45_11295, partial [Leptospiraceae bacterium]|nr:hypothetical protein [Leptospiraceae bacterium]